MLDLVSKSGVSTGKIWRLSEQFLCLFPIIFLAVSVSSVEDDKEGGRRVFRLKVQETIQSEVSEERRRITISRCADLCLNLQGNYLPDNSFV